MAKRSGFTDGYATYDPTETGYGNPKDWRETFRGSVGLDADDIFADEGEDAAPSSSSGSSGSSKGAKARKVDNSPTGIMGLPKTAEWPEIKKRYRALMREWHPDVNAHRVEEATEMVKKINTAYIALKRQFGQK